MTPVASTSTVNPNAGVLSAAAGVEARYFATAVASWYVNTIDPYAPHAQNVESRLRHPVHVITRRILYGHCDAAGREGASVHGNDDLEALFNDDDAEIKDAPQTLTRRSAARMEAFLASCSVALRAADEESHIVDGMSKIGEGATAATSSPGVTEGKGKNGKGMKKKQDQALDKPAPTTRTKSSAVPRIFPQIDRGELHLRLELYCRDLRRIRALSDANPSNPMEECVIQYVSKRGIRTRRVRLIVQTYLRNVDCVRDVHKTLMSLILRATLEALAVEVLDQELRVTVDRLASEFEHNVSFASLAFLSSPDSSAETHLVPLLTKYFEYLQTNWESLVSKCELERMLRTVLDSDLRYFFQNSVFHSVGHILDECRRERESLDNIALPPPWKEGVFGMAGGWDMKGDVDAAIEQYCSDPGLVKQALRDLRREVITVNGQILPPAHSQMELAEHIGQILNKKTLIHSLSSPSSRTLSKRKSFKKRSNYASDFGLELESEYSGTDSDASLTGKINVGLVDVLTRRLLIAASRTGTGGDAYFIVRDLFGGEEVEVVPHQSSGKVNQGSIEIIIKPNSLIIKSHGKFDIFPKPIVSENDALIQFHTTTTETVTLQRNRESSFTTLKEKKTNMTGWRTLAIRPAYYERIPEIH